MTATARRTCSEDYAYALSLMKRGISAQHIRNMTGCDVTTLRGLVKAPPYAVARPQTTDEPVRPPASAPPPRPQVRIFRGPSDPEAQRIIKETAARYGLKPRDFQRAKGPSRIAWPRQEAMWRMSTELGLSQPQISAALGLRDHSSVHYGIHRHHARLLWGEILKTIGGGR